MNLSVLIPVVAGFFLSLLLGIPGLPLLRRLKVGNTEREELESHQKKMGTPSMGGLIFILAMAIVSAFYVKACPQILPIILVTAAFGIIGLIDDILKTVLKRSDGLIAWQKFLLQFVVATGFLVYIIKADGINLEMILPFTHATLDLGWFAVVIFYLAVLGTVNGVNFTDGLDGLATTVTIVVAGFLCVISIEQNFVITPVISAMIGALLGFLMYNVYPAKVFMGDTGSLALGGFVIATAYMLQIPLFVIIVGVIYLVEVLSVILQVGYFKLTHGKRIFRMAPIHHHYELGGWSETKIVAVFSTVTALLCLLAYCIY